MTPDEDDQISGYLIYHSEEYGFICLHKSSYIINKS